VVAIGKSDVLHPSDKRNSTLTLFIDIPKNITYKAANNGKTANKCGIPEIYKKKSACTSTLYFSEHTI
jgi:hypothetical protein